MSNYVKSPTGDATLDVKVLSRLRSSLSADFSQRQLYDAVPGLFPGSVATALHLLALEGDLDASRLLSEMGHGDRTRKARVSASQALPHPLDYEWLFTKESSAFLACEARARNASRVAFVGAPSVYEACGDGHHIERIAVDRPDVLTRLAEISRVGDAWLTLDECPSHKATADLAIVDSPWYPQQTVSFAGHAASLVRERGQVLVVVPPAFTRPGVPEETDAILSQLSELGLQLVRRLPSSVRYQAPPFEVATLKAMGLFGVPHDWRVGDLLEFLVTGSIDARLVPKSEESPTWDEVRYRSSRIKFKQERTRPLELRLSSVTSGDILTSVSRRDPLRTRVSVWTSGNRGFECGDPTVLKIGFDAFVQGAGPEDAASRFLGMALPDRAADDLRRSVDHLAEIATTEENEIEWQ